MSIGFIDSYRKRNACGRLSSAALVLSACCVAFGQVPADPPKASRAFASAEAGAFRALHCEIRDNPVRIDFRFVYVVSATAQIPAEQFEGSLHYLNILLRVRTGLTDPVYLSSHLDLPPVPGTRGQEIDTDFGFAAGRGDYTVEALILDDAGRGCRREWKVSIKPPHLPGHIRAALPERTVYPLAKLPSRQETESGDVAPIGILVNASALRPRDTAVVPEPDANTLADTVFSILAQLRPGRAHVLVFSLIEQRELLNMNSAKADDAQKIARAIAAITAASSITPR